MTYRIPALFAVLLAIAAPTIAQAPGAKIVTATAAVKPTTIARGGRGTLFVTVAIAPQFHINAAKPNDPDLIPTTFQAAPSVGVKYGTPRFPAAKTISASYAKKPMLVYAGKTVIAIPFTVAKTAKPGPLALGGSLGYQGCNATSCYPPQTLPVKATVTIK